MPVLVQGAEWERERRAPVVGNRGSALLGWIEDDAEYLAQEISAIRPGAPAETRPYAALNHRRAT